MEIQVEGKNLFDTAGAAIQNRLIKIEKVDGEWYATFKPSI